MNRVPALAAVIALAGATACTHDDRSARNGVRVDAAATTAARGQEPAAAAAPRGQPRVVLSGASGDVEVAVEVVRTPHARSRGLMYRDFLAPDDGMLFLFEEEEQQSFWMKNTLIPLDMIFIRADMTVLGVVESATPQTTTPRAVPGESRYVLEVNGGWAREHGVGAGARVRFEQVP